MKIIKKNLISSAKILSGKETNRTTQANGCIGLNGLTCPYCPKPNKRGLYLVGPVLIERVSTDIPARYETPKQSRHGQPWLNLLWNLFETRQQVVGSYVFGLSKLVVFILIAFYSHFCIEISSFYSFVLDPSTLNLKISTTQK